MYPVLLPSGQIKFEIALATPRVGLTLSFLTENQAFGKRFSTSCRYSQNFCTELI